MLKNDLAGDFTYMHGTAGTKVVTEVRHGKLLDLFDQDSDVDKYQSNLS